MPQPSDQGFIFTPPPEGKPYLGNLSTVNAVVQRFADAISTANHEFHTGVLTRDECLEKMHTACTEMGEAFAGNDDEYTIAPWQGSRLAARVRTHLPAAQGGDDASAIAAHFEWVATQLTHAYNHAATGTADEQIGPVVKTGLSSLVKMLLGVE
jgi:hypothetical protein